MPIVDLDNINADDASDSRRSGGASFVRPKGFYRMRLTDIKDMTKPGKAPYYGTTWVHADDPDQWVFGGWSFYSADFLADMKRDMIRMGVPADQLSQFDTDNVFPLLLNTEHTVFLDIEDDYKGRTSKDGKVLQNNVVVYVADPNGRQEVSAGAKSDGDFNWDDK